MLKTVVQFFTNEFTQSTWEYIRVFCSTSKVLKLGYNFEMLYDLYGIQEMIFIFIVNILTSVDSILTG